MRRNRRILASFGLATLSIAALGCDSGSGIVPVDSRYINPDSIDFGPRAIGGTYSLGARLSNESTVPLIVTDVTFDPDVAVFQARTEPQGGILVGSSMNVGGTIDVRVNFVPREVGNFDTTMTISLTGGDVSVDVPLQITASGIEGTGDIEVLPTSVDFGDVELSRKVRRRISVENVGDRVTILERILIAGSSMPAEEGFSPFFVTELDTDDVVRDIVLDAGERQSFDLWFEPDAPSRMESELEFQFSQTRPLSLATAGAGVMPGSLDCLPAMHDFGQMIRGQSATQTISCSVRGGSYTIAAALMGSGGSRLFTLIAAPSAGTSYADGQSFDLTVQFVAQGLPEAHTATLEISPAHVGAPTTVRFDAEVVAPPLGQADLTASLTWNTSGTDLDLHLVRSSLQPFDDRHDCFYSSKNPDWGTTEDPIDDPFLDRDDTNGFGPEEINVSRVNETLFDVYVHYYNRPPGRSTTATLKLYLKGTEVASRDGALTACGQLWHAGRITYDQNGNGQFVPVDQVLDYSARADSDCQ